MLAGFRYQSSDHRRPSRSGPLAVAWASPAVEGRQVEDGDLLHFAIDPDFFESQLGRRLFEVDLVADDRDAEALGGVPLAQNRQVYLGAALAPYQANDVA